MRANSFNFVPLRDLARPRGSDCPLRDDPERIAQLLAGIALCRALFLRLPDRMRLCSTPTSDFDERELDRIKTRSGQLYADVSSKLAPDDFSTDFVKLRLCRECVACEHAARCARCYAAEPHNAFVRDDARVRELLRSMSGRLLDIGCGEAPYLSELDPSRVEYVGVDPDAERIDLLRTRYRWARFVIGTSGALDASLGEFSHVLSLRSHNHLPDPEHDLARAVELLAPGGTLLLVDNEAFGLVRSREHAARAEASQARFEHHRNHGAEQAHASVSGLELIERRDVTPDTSNQWLLHYRKPRR